MMIRIILQARMNSVRLPRKSMLPIAGYPLAILSGLRLTRDSNFQFVAALPSSSDCNVLAASFKHYKLDTFRGPQLNVLKRFILASADLDSADVIVRATADNVIPDSSLVNMFVEFFLSEGLTYLGPKNFFLPLPQGVGVEVFTVESLRRSFTNNFHGLDKEHVTYSMASRINPVHLVEFKNNKNTQSSYSIDTLSEYLNIKQLLESKCNSIKATWKEILDA